MLKDLLATKLFIPPTRPALVPRPWLIDRLNEGLSGKLILISAPAGFGKTTLLSAWASQCPMPSDLVDQRGQDRFDGQGLVGPAHGQRHFTQACSGMEHLGGGN